MDSAADSIKGVQTELARLQLAEAAYTRGDYRALRRELAALQPGVETPAAKARIAELERASAEDPAFAVVVAVLAAGLFVVVARYILG